MAYPPSGPSLLPRWQAGRSLVLIAGGVVLVLLLCCIGGVLALRGDDDPDAEATTAAPATSTSTTETEPPTSTSTSTSSTSTSSSTTSSTTTTSATPTSSDSPSEVDSETSPPEPSGSSTAPEIVFPDSFDGWTKSESATPSLALYRKGDDALSVIAIPPDQVNAFYERLWEEPTTHGDVVCGKLSTSANYQCAGAVDDAGLLVSASAETAAETAQILTGLLEAIAAA